MKFLAILYDKLKRDLTTKHGDERRVNCACILSNCLVVIVRMYMYNILTFPLLHTVTWQLWWFQPTALPHMVAHMLRASRIRGSCWIDFDKEHCIWRQQYCMFTHVCYGCGAEGHTSLECPERKKPPKENWGKEGDDMNPGGNYHIPSHYWVRDADQCPYPTLPHLSHVVIGNTVMMYAWTTQPCCSDPR